MVGPREERPTQPDLRDFASESIRAALLIEFLRTFLDNFADERICLMFQNANHSDKNKKWEAFKLEMKRRLFPLYEDECEEISYYDVTG
ncbi:MAG: hypothetical protein V4719_21945 [Planctomycetota bacterium]